MFISTPFWSDFNDYVRYPGTAHKYKFQPHFGLILMILMRSKISLVVLISTPFWSDFNWKKGKETNAFTWISTPFWSDFNIQGCTSIQESWWISTPFWSDFNTCIFCEIKECEAISTPFWSDFNFWIDAVQFKIVYIHFNPILVWF